MLHGPPPLPVWAIEREFARAPEDIRRHIRWLPLGVEVEIGA